MLFAQEGAAVRDFGVKCTRWRCSARFRCYLQKKALQCEISVLFAKEGVIVRDFGVVCTTWRGSAILLFAKEGVIVRDFGVVCTRWRGSARFRCYLQKKAL